jgi:hypothetical protein
METTVTIPEPLVNAADHLAAELEISRSELYTMALEAFVKSRQPREITRALDEVYPSESSKLDPVVWQMQLASLARDDW